MLKENKSVFIPSLHIVLEFDEQDTKDIMIYIGDKVKATFLKDGEVQIVSGKVTKMYPELGTLNIDCSTQYNSLVETITVSLLMDIEKVVVDPPV